MITSPDNKRGTAINNGIGYTIVSRELHAALAQTQRREKLLDQAFSELDQELEGNYRGIAARKGRGWVMGRGAEFATLHTELITAVVPFGDTFEHSRRLREHIAANELEIEAASRDLGIMIFEDLARQFVGFHAPATLVNEDTSAKVWQAAFQTPAKAIERHMLEARYETVTNAAGEQYEKPVISRIWAILPGKPRTGEKYRRLDDYKDMMAEALNNDIMELLAANVKMTLVVPADSVRTGISEEELAAEGIEIMELPMAIGQFDAIGYTMLADRARSADAATKRDMLRYKTPEELQPVAVQAAFRRHVADSLPNTVTTSHPAFTGGRGLSWQQRLQEAYPSDFVPED